MIEQLLAHLVGDYIFQTDAMATRKTSRSGWALADNTLHLLCNYAALRWL